MEVVFDLVRRSIGLWSVALSTFGGGGSTVCVTLDLVLRAMGLYFPWVGSTLGSYGSALGVGMNTLGSEALCCTGA